ncbi:hypothetical protein C1I98_04860 [Spongiactinospora gelatinilytica]|uniref:HTH cro/C1-type domain-containing protein n=2 Tax=Spongiactinospora gelatinilytica TaxID=2666298 RepID=A0A2W2GWQ3_9ACTN|nr:hypothetical protein C1I98_04860 [Spongiactinospora gelatinilytica]
MTREVLAGLVGKSESWLKRVEKGRLQQNPRLPILLEFAEALRVRDLSEITGDQSMPVRMFTGPGHPALAAVRAAVNALPVQAADGAVQPLGTLRTRLDRAWQIRHSSPDHRTALGALLPDLLRDAQVAAQMYRGDTRRRAQAVLAETYGLTPERVAGRLPAQYYQPWTSFSRIIMKPHAVTIAVELHKSGEAARQADRAGSTAIPSVPRRGRHLIEVARARRLRRDHSAVLGTLQLANRTAPETIRYNGFARRMVLELVEAGPAGLR